MRVLVCGGRDFSKTAFAYDYLSKIHKRTPIDVVIEGNARGADRIAGFWARSKGIANLKFRANWERDGKAAGPIRNQRMMDEGRPDLVVAFPGGRGTADMIQRARKVGVEVLEVREAQ